MVVLADPTAATNWSEPEVQTRGRVEQTPISREASAAAKGCEGVDFCRFRERAGSPTEDAGTCVRLPRPLAIGLDLSIYDPAFDADRSCARRLVGLLEQLASLVK